MERVEEINKCFAVDESITIKKKFEQNEQIVEGEISIREENIELCFIVHIYSPYPLQFHEQETIKFINKEFIEFDHVNFDGSICVHTFHSPELREKIELDINSLRHWIRRYYINHEKDQHYEHIVVPDKDINGERFTFLFTDTEEQFTKSEFGAFNYSILRSVNDNDIKRTTLIIQSFKIGKKQRLCRWNTFYRNLKREEGLFVFIENPPVVSKRFIISNWQDLDKNVNQPFFKYLYDISETYRYRTVEHRVLPLLIGYRINDKKIHWQTALIQTQNFPNYSKKVLGTNVYLGMFNDAQITWAQTKNISYEYYFGRGALHSRFIERKVMIIGIGAIGSIVAIILARGGIKNIAVVDYDIKEPENVCRSEYSFDAGIASKTNELSKRLVDVSPFIEIEVSEIFFDFAKFAHNKNEAMKILKRRLQDYELIIDCSADHEVAYLLDKFNLNVEIVSLSLTNQANELICVVNPNLYRWSIDIHNKLKREDEDLYNPTGCWNPTFRASYNDVNTLVQYAIKQINYCYVNEIAVRNFYLAVEFKQELTIKLNQF